MLSPAAEAQRLTKKFKLNVRRTEMIQGGVYRVTTNSGKVYCMKRMPLPPARIRWIDRTLSQLRRQNKQLRFGWTEQKARLYVQLSCFDCPPFMLIPWYKGAWPSPSSTAQMNACGMLLAKFHQAASKIRLSGKGQHRTAGTMPAYFKKELRILQSAIRNARQHRYRSPLDGMLSKHGAFLLSMGKASLQALKKSGYAEACQKQKLTLCHGDFGPTNIIRTKKGMVIIDFETLRIDHRTFDLYKAIYNFSQYNGWNFNTAKAFLDGYQKVLPLTRLDYNVLKALLRFPRGLSKHIFHYRMKSAVLKREIEQDFPRILSYEQNRSAFLRKLEAYAKKRI